MKAQTQTSKKRGRGRAGRGVGEGSVDGKGNQTKSLHNSFRAKGK